MLGKVSKSKASKKTPKFVQSKSKAFKNLQKIGQKNYEKDGSKMTKNAPQIVKHHKVQKKIKKSTRQFKTSPIFYLAKRPKRPWNSFLDTRAFFLYQAAKKGS